MDECKPLIIGKRGATVNRIQDETGANVQIDQRIGECVVFGSPQQVGVAADMIRKIIAEGDGQGLTLVPFSPQRKRFVWDRGCIEGFFRGCLGGVRGYRGYLGCILCQKRLRLS